MKVFPRDVSETAGDNRCIKEKELALKSALPFGHRCIWESYFSVSILVLLLLEKLLIVILLSLLSTSCT